MEKVEIKLKKLKKHILSIVIIVLVIAWLFVSFLLFYSKTSIFTTNIRANQLKLNVDYLSEVIDNKAGSATGYVNTLADLFSSYNGILDKGIVHMLTENALETGNFDDIIITDSKGNGVDSTGSPIDISRFDEFEKALSGKNGRTGIHLVNSTQIFATYSPIIRNNIIVGGVFGIHNPKSFFKDIKMNLAEKLSFFVFENTGEIIYSSKNDAPSIDGYTNIFSYMSNLTYEETSAFQGFEEALIRNEVAEAIYTGDGEAIISHASPLNKSGWHVMVNTPKLFVNSEVENILNWGFILLINALSAFIILAAIMILYRRRSRAIFTKATHELKLSNEVFNLAMEHITSDIFEYNVSNDQITFVTNKNSSLFIPESIAENNLPYDTVENIFGSESSEVREIFNTIKRGEKFAACTVRMLKTDGSTAWGKISLSNICDDENHPVRAVGIIEDVTKYKEGEELYKKEEQYRSTILAETILALEINLTRNIYIRINPVPIGKAEWIPYSSRSMTYSTKIHPDDLNLFSMSSSRKKLLRDFEDGNTKHYIKFRMKNNAGDFIWVSSATHLLSDPASGDIKAFTYVRDIDAEERKAAELQNLADTDQLTGILNRASFENAFNEFLRKPSSDGEMHALLYIDLDNFKTINDTFGHVEGDNVLCNTASALSSIMREDDLVARMGGDEFMVLITHFKGKRYIRGRAAEICAALSSIKITDDMNVSASIGGVMIPIDGMSFQTLYKKADGALYLSKRSGKNKFIFYNDED